MDKRVSIAFYQVNRKTAVMPPFSSALVSAAPSNGTYQIHEVKGARLRLERLETIGSAGMQIGEIIRLQSDDLPGMASDTTDRQRLPLPDGYGLAHSMVFAYDASLDILAMQKVRNGINTVRTAGYLREVSAGAVYSFLPILRRDALERVSNLTCTKIRVKVANPEDLTWVETDDQTVQAAMRNLQELSGSSYVDVTLGISRTGGSLRNRAVLAMANWLMGNAVEDRGGISVLNIQGEDADDPERAEEAVNLLTDRLQVEQILPLGEDFEANYQARKHYLLGQFEEQREYLRYYATAEAEAAD